MGENAAGGSRTLMALRPLDFKSNAYTSFATAARYLNASRNIIFKVDFPFVFFI